MFKFIVSSPCVLALMLVSCAQRSVALGPTTVVEKAAKPLVKNTKKPKTKFDFLKKMWSSKCVSFKTSFTSPLVDVYFGKNCFKPNDGHWALVVVRVLHPVVRLLVIRAVTAHYKQIPGLRQVAFQLRKVKNNTVALYLLKVTLRENTRSVPKTKVRR